MQEAVILPVTLLLIFLHVWGRRKNRRMARNWAVAHIDALREEYALVGFGAKPKAQVTEVTDPRVFKSFTKKPVNVTNVFVS